MPSVDPDAGTSEPIGGPSLSAIGAQMQQAERTRRLQAWAASRGIKTDTPEGMVSAIMAAAFDHPEVREEKRGRGRPRKYPSLIERYTKSDREGDDLLHRVSLLHAAILLQRGAPITDTQALRILCQLDGINPAHVGRLDGEVRRRKPLLSKARRRRRVSKLVAE